MDQKDAATFLVLSSHLQLQKEGFLSTWTNSFVGPWDPSQGLHNPGKKCKSSIMCFFFNVAWAEKKKVLAQLRLTIFGYAPLEEKGLPCTCLHYIWPFLFCNCITDEKIKLWLFLPGRHSSVAETAQAAVSRLRGIKCFWVFSGVLMSFSIILFVLLFGG